MLQQTVYYQDSDVRVTGARAVLGTTTYAMANVAAVSVSTKPANRAPGVIVASIGLIITGCMGCMGTSVIGSDSGAIVLAILGMVPGVAMLLAGIAVAVAAKNEYTVRIGSTSGGVVALVSTNRERVGNIVDAVNEAIIRRG